MGVWVGVGVAVGNGGVAVDVAAGNAVGVESGTTGAVGSGRSATGKAPHPASTQAISAIRIERKRIFIPSLYTRNGERVDTIFLSQ